MKTMVGFLRALIRLPRPWVAWVALLMVANMVAPLAFIDTVEARVVLAVAFLGVVIQTAIFAARGFVRLLGIGHIAWLPLLPWLWGRLDGAPEGSVFATWILVLLIVNGLSLLIDATDVIRYLRGETEPQV